MDASKWNHGLCGLAKLAFVFSLMLVLGQVPSRAQHIYRVEMYGGLAFTEETTLHIQQSGHPDTTLTGVQYSSREFEAPPYYGLRIARLWDPRQRSKISFGAELELIHDKIHLETANDPGDVVQKFHVTDGLNFLVFNALATTQLPRNWQVAIRTGPALVITHPETIVRGMANGRDGDLRGYRYSGLAGHFAINASRQITARSRLFLEYKSTWAHPVMSIAEGSASTPIRTNHIVMGWSWAF